MIDWKYDDWENISGLEQQHRDVNYLECLSPSRVNHYCDVTSFAVITPRRTWRGELEIIALRLHKFRYSVIFRPIPTNFTKP